LRAVEDANKINQDNTTLIVIDIKEREVRYEAEPAAVIAAPAEPVSRVADVEIPEEPREPRSYKWLVWLIVLGLFGGGGYFAWQQGIIDDAMEKGTDLVESTTQTIEAELEAEPEPVTEPEAEPMVEDEPEPEPAPEPEIEPTYVDKPDAFRDRLKSGGYGPTMIKVPAGTFRYRDARLPCLPLWSPSTRSPLQITTALPMRPGARNRKTTAGTSRPIRWSTSPGMTRLPILAG
jgi:hypothetical protein